MMDLMHLIVSSHPNISVRLNMEIIDTSKEYEYLDRMGSH